MQDNQPIEAKKYRNILVFLGLIFPGICCGTLMGLKDEVPPRYTDLPKVLDAIDDAFLITLGALWLDTWTITNFGIIRGLGVYFDSFICILVGWFGLGLPLGYYLGNYADDDIEALWTGLLAGIGTLTVLVLLVSYFRYDWVKLAEYHSDPKRSKNKNSNYDY